MGTLHQFRRFVGDSLTNLVSGLGTMKDAYTHTQYSYTVLDRVQLEAAYRSDWLARAIVDAPAEDATREWREWQTDQANIEKLETAEKDFDLQRKLKRAMILARLYGGSAIVMGVDVGKAEDELDIERVKQDSLHFIEVFHQYELTPGQLIRDIGSPWFNRPEYYMLGANVENINKKTIASGVMIHPSRVIALAGNEIPDIRTAGSHVWGDSVLQVVDDAVKATGSVVQGVATLIADSKMDVIKIPGLSKHLSDDALSSKLIGRFMTANQMKSMVNTLLLDEKETWERVQTSFAALPQLIQEFLTVAAGASGIPVSRLLGMARGKGIGGTEGGGEVDTRTYYDHISDMQRNELSPTLTPLDEIFVRSVLGHDDDSIYYEWTPLWQLSDAEKADISNKKAVTAQADVSMALINPDVLRDCRINQLIEDGFYPGIEDAIDEHGAEPEEPPQPTPEDMTAHIGMMQKSASQLQQLGKHALTPPDQQKQLPPPSSSSPPALIARDAKAGWSDEARLAALEARRRNAKGKPEEEKTGKPAAAPKQESTSKRYSDEDKQKAVSWYQGEGYKEINSALRSGKPLQGPYKNIAEAMDELIAHSATAHDQTVYRGIDFSGKNFTPKMFTGAVGKDITLKGYTSTSTDAERMQNFGETHFKIDLPKGSHAYDTKSDENELILPRDAKFTVMAADQKKDKNGDAYYEIHLRHDS